MMKNTTQMMLETQDRYQPNLTDPVGEAPDLLPGVTLFVDMQKNRTSDQGLPPGFIDALFQATTMTGVTLWRCFRYVDNLLPCLNPETENSSPVGQLEELLGEPMDCQSAAVVKMSRNERKDISV